MRIATRVRIATGTTIVVVGLLMSLLVAVAPPAPAMTYAPSTSPPAAVHYAYTGGGVQCESGYACATLEYPAGQTQFVFKFYNYGTYALSHWSGTGWAINSQTGGAAMRILDRNGYQITCVPPGPWRYVNWDPAWYIRLTSSPC